MLSFKRNENEYESTEDQVLYPMDSAGVGLSLRLKLDRQGKEKRIWTYQKVSI